MITWILYMVFTPITIAEICTWAWWCGILLGSFIIGFIIGQIFQIIEKVLDNHRK